MATSSCRGCGSTASVAGGQLFNGTERVNTYDLATGDLQKMWMGRRVIVKGDIACVATDTKLIAYDRTQYPDADLHPRFIKHVRKTYQDWLKRYQDRLAKEKEGSSRRAQLEERIAKFEAKLKRIQNAGDNPEQALKESIKWQRKADYPHALIIAGETLVAGGKDQVLAVAIADGREIASLAVEGQASGLAAAGGRLFVSTDKGRIHCFGAKAVAAKRVEPKVDPKPYSSDTRRRVAEAVLRDSQAKRGYALVLGCGDGQLAFELATQSELTVVAVEPDENKVEAARRRLAAAGLLGSRVTVHRMPLSAMPLPDYFANLIVCEESFTSGTISTPAEELLRMLKPMGGVAYMGLPSGAKGIGKTIKPDRLAAWLKKLGNEGVRVKKSGGASVTITRGALPGAGNWTHQYANAGNTACSDDQRVKGPLGILWFGFPGPAKMAERHAAAAAPLSLDGRLFVQGENWLMAYDAYNGVKLWDRPLPGAFRAPMKSGIVKNVVELAEASNLAVSRQGLFVAVKDRCHMLDLDTGETRKTFDLPPGLEGDKHRWGYTACVDGRLFGSTMTAQGVSDGVFAIDVTTGRRWHHKATHIRHGSIAVADGCMVVIDSPVTPEQRDAALKARPAQAKVDNRGKPIETDVRLVMALDAATGRKVWEKPLDVSDCVKVGIGGGDISVMASHKVVLLAAQPWNGHFWRQFFAGEFDRRSLIALSADDGRLLWSGRKGYRSRPLVVGKTIYAEPWAYDLLTGEPKTRIHPVTGERTRWQMSRPGHHCGCIAAAPNYLFFRSASIAYYDLLNDYGTAHFGAQRPGCWINFIPAAGLVLIPEASSGCMCAYAIHCTVVFHPRQRNRAWGLFSATGEMTPVKHLAINLGAPGDRRGFDDTLWLAYPRLRGGRLAMTFRIPIAAPTTGYYWHKPERIIAPRQGTARATAPIVGSKNKAACPEWVFASGNRGITKIIVPLNTKKEDEGTYRVLLFFADPDANKPGQRVFDIKVQDKIVAKGFDIVAEAGGPNRPVIQQCEGVRAGQSLRIELVPSKHKPSPSEAPVLCGFTVVRTPAK